MANVSDDYYRVYRALHFVTHEAVPCVDHCVRVWHQNQTLASCTTQCPDGRKPKSCQQCVAWAKAIEAVYYSPSHAPQVNWSNINPSVLGRSHVEVAKAFTLRLPKTRGSATQYTAMSDFDSASLLMIMARFREFHQTDQASYDHIMKVSGIRNDLSHVKLKDNMQLDHQKVKQYFKDIEDFVTCLENLHPTHFTAGQNIKTQLKEIQLEPITEKMKKEIHLKMQKDLEGLRQSVTELKRELVETTSELKRGYHETTSELKRGYQKTTSELKRDYQKTTSELKRGYQKTTSELKRGYHETTSELKHVVRDEITNINIKEKDGFIRCWRSLDCVVTKSIPCLRNVLKHWMENKRKTIKPCQRPRPRPPEAHDECSEEGKPVPGSSCANCVAWGKAVEDEYYLQTSTATIPWDTINPMCLARSHLMIAKAFAYKSHVKCTKLEDMDVGCLLDIMRRFKGFMGQEKSSYDIVGKIQQETITLRMWQDVDRQIQRCEDGFSPSEMKEQIQSIKETLDSVVTQRDTDTLESNHREKFIKCCTAIHYTVTKSIPCLINVLQRWQRKKQKSIQGCQRAQSASNHGCKMTGKPTSALSCANCVAWGEAVEDSYYPGRSKSNIPWDTIDPTCLSYDITMVAKTFMSSPDKATEVTQLEDVDLSSLLDVMMRFKDFLGREKNTHQILKKISDITSMLTEMREAQVFNLKDQQVEEIFHNIGEFVSCLATLHAEWFTDGNVEDIKRTLMKIKTTPFAEWIKEGLPRVHEIMKAFDSTKHGDRLQSSRPARNHRQEHDPTLKKCQGELHRYYLDYLCKIPLFPGDYDSYVDLKNIYTKLSFEIKLPSPCKPVKMPLFSYSDMFERKSVEGRPYTRFLITAPAGLGKTTLTAKIANDWITKEEEALKDIDLLFVINMRLVDHSSNLEEVIVRQMFPEDTSITSDDIFRLLQRYSQSTIVILDAIDESDRKLYHDKRNRGTLVKFLSGKMLLPCKMLTTSRPWRIREITQEYRAFAQVEINGFNKKDIREYIKKFFREDRELGESLIKHANQNKLIDEIAYIPLMSLLICVYWREVQQDVIPHRITQLYDAIINIMHDHYLKKQSSTNHFENIQALINQMGKMALGGFWPPENRVVFSSTEMTNSENVEIVCQMGFLAKQEPRPSIIKRSSPTKATLTFFHKTCGEKCAGDYLGHLAEQEPKELMTKLSQLETADDALSVRLILQFACGSSRKAAEGILDRLMRLYCEDKSVCQEKVAKHNNELLELEETLKVQNFLDLCLRCNYEANCAAEFSDRLRLLFPLSVNGYRFINIIGISAFTSVALGYFLSNSSSSLSWSIRLRPAAHPNCHPYLIGHGPLVNISSRARRSVNQIPVDTVRAVCLEYIAKHPDMHLFNKALLQSSPAELLCRIDMWQACEELPTAEESDVDSIFDSTRNIRLVALNLNSFNIPKRNIDKLLQMIHGNYLLSLLRLDVSFISMMENQMLHLAKNLKKMPHLMELSMRVVPIEFGAKESQPRRVTFLSILAESMPAMKSLQILHLDHTPSSRDDMDHFVQKFPWFASQLRELTLNHAMSRVMANDTVSKFAEHIVTAKKLEKFSIGFDYTIHQSIQNKFLSQLCHLHELFEVHIFFMKYPDDAVTTIARAMKSLPNLQLLAFSSPETLKLSVNTTTWKELKDALLQIERMTDLRILHVWFTHEDLVDLLAVCRERHYRLLMFSAVCWPNGLAVPNDEFLSLH